MCDGDEENSILSLTPSQEGAPPESLTDPLRVDWPKDRMLINRINNLCSLVLTGHWPSGRRYVSDIQLNTTSEELVLGGDLGYPRVARKSNSSLSAEALEGQESEFTVKLLKVRWCSDIYEPQLFLTFLLCFIFTFVSFSLGGGAEVDFF